MTFHIVRMNEKIEKIALNYQLEVDEIKEFNKYIKDWNHLIPGTKLRLPEISSSLNEELDNEEPFIEEYYPKLDTSKYHMELQDIHEEKNIKLENVSESNSPKKQEMILPSTNYSYPKQYYHPYHYYMPFYQDPRRIKK